MQVSRAKIDVQELKAKTAGKSKVEVAKICGVGVNSLYNASYGYLLTCSVAKKISDALGLTKTNFDVGVPSVRIHKKVAIFDRYEFLNALLQKNLSQKKFADLVDIHKETVARALKGRKIRRSIALKIDKALDLKKTRYFS